MKDVSLHRTGLWSILLIVSTGCGDDGAGAAGRDDGRDVGDVATFDTADALSDSVQVDGDATSDGTGDPSVDADVDAARPDASADADADIEAGGGDGTPCSGSTDCESGQCVTLAPGGPAVCASLCTSGDDCAADEDCVLLVATGADGLRVCLALDFCLDADNDEWGVGPACLGRDCNDDDPGVNPGVNEVCNGRDDDCDGVTDDTPVGQGERCDTGFQGICSAGVSQCIEGVLVCEALQTASADGCDGLDNDCDGAVDEQESSDRTWYRDSDNDRFGDAEFPVQACDAPAGYVDVAGDCNDEDRTINPNAVEICDGVDNDCDATIDAGDGVLPSTWYRDGDTDGFGDPDESIIACARPDGYVANAGDCNDRATAVNPEAVEVCDTIDNDCDDTTDPDDAFDAPVWYIDLDEDGAGDPRTTRRSCTQPAGYVAAAGDCDDSDDTLPATGTRTFSLDTNLPVPPAGQSSGITVARVPVASGGVVQGLRIQVTVLHTDTGDITMTLVSPQGTRVVLARERGFDDNYVQTTFSDSASAAISSSSNPFTGTWRPEQPLSAFNGQSAAGEWLLEVSDRFTLEDGSIRRVRLDLDLGCPADL